MRIFCRLAEPNAAHATEHTLNRRSITPPLSQVLNVARTDATPEDIKRAYRKAAARVHPDRNRDDPDATTKFQEVQYAYSVLSDPRLRSIYDSYGEQGLKMYEQYVSFAEQGQGGEGGLPMMNPANLLMAACVGVAVIVGLLTALAITLYLKLQGDSTAPLALMLLPLWIIESALLVALYGFLVSGLRKGADAQGLSGTAGTLAQLILLIAWEILLVLRTDGAVPTLPYVVIFAPLYILEVINATKAAQRISPASYEAEKASGATILPYGLNVARVLGGTIARGIFLLLLTLHYDGPMASSAWGIVLLPLWLLFVFSIMLSCAALQVQPSNEREQTLLMMARGKVFGTLFLGFLLLLINLALDHTITSWMPLFLIWFLIAGCFFCCCCCAVGMLRMVPTPQGQDVPPNEAYGTSGASTARSDASTTRSDASPTEDAPLLPGGSSYQTGARSPPE